MENPPIKDVFPIGKGEFPAGHVSLLDGISNFRIIATLIPHRILPHILSPRCDDGEATDQSSDLNKQLGKQKPDSQMRPMGLVYFTYMKWPTVMIFHVGKLAAIVPLGRIWLGQIPGASSRNVAKYSG